MSALEDLAQWDDARFVFLLGKYHGRWELSRRARKPKEKPASFFPFCKRHHSFLCGRLVPVSGMTAFRWASERDKPRKARIAREAIAA